MVHHGDDTGSIPLGRRLEHIEEHLEAQDRDTTQSFGKVWLEIDGMKKDHAILDKLVSLGQLRVTIYFSVAFFVLSLVANWVMKKL